MTFLGLFGNSKGQAHQVNAAAGLNAQTSVQGKPIPLCYGTTRIAPNLIWYGDFIATQQASSSGAGGKGGVGGGGGGKGGGGSSGYTYTTSYIASLCEGQIVGIGNAWVDKNITSLSSLGLSLFTGALGQAAWGYMTTNHPSQALGYNNIAYLAAASYALGTSPQLANHNFEVKGLYSQSIMISGSYIPDADPSLVVNDILTNSVHGLGFPSSRIASLSTYQAYCIANGLWISPYYGSQSQTSAMLDDIANATNSAFVWSSGQLKIVPYGDQSITANGYTYTAPSSPLYSLTDDDFLENRSSNSGDCVVLTRKRPSDTYNSVKVEWLDRNNSYNPAITEARDESSITIYGLRPASVNALHMFCDGNAAALSANLQLRRQMIRNTYNFVVDQRYIGLDPMDIIAITDTRLGLTNQWVRVTNIQENDDYTLTIDAEDYLAGTGSAPLYSFQTGSGFEANYNSSPGSVNTPVVFEPPVQITETGLEVWMSVSGGSNYGGCDVWISTDNSNYKKAGRISGQCRQGVLTALLSSGSDPDTVNTLSVNLSESYGQLTSGTQNDADNNHTLCYVDGELISFETATLTSSYHYNLTYLRRGQYGTSISSHANNSAFARLDSNTFTYSYDKSKIGQTLYIKLLAFNIYGGGIQSLASVSPYTYTIKGPPLPAQVQNFAAQQSGNVVVFTWTDLTTDAGLKGYDIAYGPVSSAWSAKQLLTEAHRGTEMTNAAVPPGTWEFSIRAHDVADNLGPASTVSLIVTNTNTIIANSQQEPGWLGTLNNFYRHWSGILVPTSQHNANYYNPVSAPSAPTLSSTAGGSLSGATYYVKVTYLDANGETTVSAESNLAVAANNLLVVTSPATSGLAVSYNVYVSTGSGTETLQNASPVALGANWTMPATGLISGASPPGTNTTGWQVFNQFVPDPVSSASYIAPTIDTGYNDNLRVYSTMAAVAGPAQTGQASLEYLIDTWLSGGSDPSTYTPWTIGFVNMEYLKGELQYNSITSGQVFYISDFTVIVDNPQGIENAVATISPGGSSVTFPMQFHAPPYVEATVIGATGLYAEASNVTAQGCTFNVFNSSGTSVGGTINYTATGA